MPKLQGIIRGYLVKKCYRKMKKEKERSNELLKKLKVKVYIILGSDGRNGLSETLRNHYNM